MLDCKLIVIDIVCDSGKCDCSAKQLSMLYMLYIFSFVNCIDKQNEIIL